MSQISRETVPLTYLYNWSGRQQTYCVILIGGKIRRIIPFAPYVASLTRLTIIDNSLTIFDDTLTILDDKLTIVDNSLTIVDDTLTIVDDKLTIIDDKLTTVDDTLTGPSQNIFITLQVYYIMGDVEHISFIIDVVYVL
jgi:hypothetical protein